jgi:P-type Ca2+ transporter type 2C
MLPVPFCSSGTVVVLNALIGLLQEHAAERTAEALQAMVPHAARMLRGGELAEIPAEELMPADAECKLSHDALARRPGQ